MKKLLLILTFAIAAILSYGISTAEEKIVICGTGDSQELLRLLAANFVKSHPGTTVDVPDSIGSGGGIKATASGLCDLGRIARHIKKSEKKYNLQYRDFAISPVVFITNKRVKGISSLTSKEIIDIYSGRITHWSSVGGKNAKIYVANREAGDSSRSVLEKNLSGFKEIEHFAGRFAYSTQEVIGIIQNHDNTIGYSALAASKGFNINIIKIDGVFPSEENVQAGSYKLVTPFGIVWKGELKGLNLNFVNYLFSPEGRKIISEHGAIPASS